ncbi:MAG: hypothetical protein U0841_13165 [Chloroflexia bacterium]
MARCGGGGLLGACLEACAAEEAATGLAELRDLLLGPPRAADSFGRYIGEDRAWEMVANIVLPFALAYGAWSEDERLGAGAAALWEAAPATAGNEPIRALLGQIGGGKAIRLKTSQAAAGRCICISIFVSIGGVLSADCAVGTRGMRREERGERRVGRGGDEGC